MPDRGGPVVVVALVDVVTVDVDVRASGIVTVDVVVGARVDTVIVLPPLLLIRGARAEGGRGNDVRSGNGSGPRAGASAAGGTGEDAGGESGADARCTEDVAGDIPSLAVRAALSDRVLRWARWWATSRRVL